MSTQKTQAMNHKGHVLVLGGYGTFGSRIVSTLASKGYKVSINGRNQNKAQRLANKILQKSPQAQPTTACFDVQTQLSDFLQKLRTQEDACNSIIKKLKSKRYKIY